MPAPRLLVLLVAVAVPATTAAGPGAARGEDRRFGLARMAVEPLLETRTGNPAPRPRVEGPLTRQVERMRLAAIAQRVLSITVCGRRDRGDDTRRSHAKVHDGDLWLARGDAVWDQALRGSPERFLLDRALRRFRTAHDRYVQARQRRHPISYAHATSPAHGPALGAYPEDLHEGARGRGEPVREHDPIWGRWNEIPLEPPIGPRDLLLKTWSDVRWGRGP
jgi:hypothetical protein